MHTFQLPRFLSWMACRYFKISLRSCVRSFMVSQTKICRIFFWSSEFFLENKDHVVVWIFRLSRNQAHQKFFIARNYERKWWQYFELRFYHFFLIDLVLPVIRKKFKRYIPRLYRFLHWAQIRTFFCRGEAQFRT